MRPVARARALGGASLFAACAAACDGGAQCKAYVTPAGTDLASPAVSFRADVLPIFVQSCAFSSCHGTMSAQNNGVYLGERTGTTPTATLIAGLEKPAPALPSMPFVTPGDPSRSFLMHKIDGDACTLDPRCTNGSCGGRMPQGGGAPLPVATREAVRRWIAQGAKDD